MDNKTRQGLLEIHAATVLFGLAGLFGKLVTLSPFLIVLARVFFAGLALGILLAAMKQSLREILRKAVFLLVILGAILAVHWVAFFKSIQVSSVAVGLLSYSCFPVFTVLLEPLLFKQRTDKLNLLFAGLCLAGVFLMIPRFDPADLVFQGVLWGVFSGLAFSVLTVFNRRLSQHHSSLAIAFFEDLFAGVFLLPFFFMYRSHITAGNLLLLLILGVVCTAGSHTLFIKGMRYVRAQSASIISSLEPVYGIILAFFVLQEAPALRTITGGIIILGAAITVSAKETVRSI